MREEAPAASPPSQLPAVRWRSPCSPGPLLPQTSLLRDSCLGLPVGLARLPGPFQLSDSLVFLLTEVCCFRLEDRKPLKERHYPPLWKTKSQIYMSKERSTIAHTCFPSTGKHCLIEFTFNSIWYFLSLWLGPLRYLKRGSS